MGVVRTTVRSGETARVELNVQGTAGLEGTVYNNGAARCLISVQVGTSTPLMIADPWRYTEGVIGFSWVSKSGIFDLVNLPAGTFTVVAVAFNQEEVNGRAVVRNMVYASQQITLGAGQRTQLNFDLK